MASGLTNSTLAVSIANRAKLSAVRQRIGLEQGNQNQMAPQSNMQPAGPVGANTPVPTAVVGPQAQAAMGPDMGGINIQPPQQPPTGGAATPPEMPPHQMVQQGPSNPQANTQMMAMVSNFLTQHGPQQQQLIDQQKTQQPEAQQPVAPMGDQQSLSHPIAEFYKAMKRLPSPQELVVMGAQQKLQAQLGRPPTSQEISSFLKPTQQPSASPEQAAA